MGMFGGDKKKNKQEDEQEAKRPTQRRSRRIVTPGSKPGGAGGSDAETARRPGSGAVVRQRPRQPSGPAAPQQGVKPQRPAQPAPAEPPPIEIGNATMIPADNAPAGGLDLGGPSAGPGIAKGAGSRPITEAESSDLEFGGSLDLSSPSSSGVNRSGDQPLIDFLVSKAALISPEQARQAKAKAEAEGTPIDLACTSLGLIDEEQLVNALTQECWVPHLKVDKYEIRKKALDTIAEVDARRFSVLPVDKLGSILNLAMVNPLDVEAIRVLESKTGLDIKKVVATRSEIDQGINKYYGGITTAKEGGLEIAQDHESRRVTQMLSKTPVSPAAPIPPPAPAPRPAASIDPMGFDDVADIDDLLSSDEAVKPSIIEAITIGDDELEPDIEDLDTGDVEVVAGPATGLIAKSSEPELEPEPQVELEPSLDMTPGSIDIGGMDLSGEDEDPFEEAAIEAAPQIKTPAPAPAPAPEPRIESPAPRPAQPAAAPPARPAAPAARPAAPTARPAAPAAARTKASGPTNLIPVMEEEFQHAITHGKSRIFEKWTSLQTRNRILNAVLVESELDPLLAELYAHGSKVTI